MYTYSKPFLRLALLAASMALATLSATTAAQKLDDDDGDGGGEPPRTCIDNANLGLSLSRTQARPDESVTLSWNVTGIAAGCNATVRVSGVTNPGRSGSHTFRPKDDTYHQLSVSTLGVTRSRDVRLDVVPPLDANGRINLVIDSNNQSRLFVEAVTSPQSENGVIRIADHVSLDLSGYSMLHLFPGVQIVGGRGPGSRGPLLFTNTYPKPLFMIGAYLPTDNVRISGIRLRGANLDVAPEDSPPSVGIRVNSGINVEIENNEISGWHVAAIQVNDTLNRIDSRNGSGAVRIRNNDLHHNQLIGEGYGVEVSDGAYALVERNTFDFNRHAIAGDGSYGSGYFFYRNFVGTGGGQHEGFLGIDYKTHQVDMHGQDDCWGADGYCGVAGEYMDIRHNMIRYTDGLAINLRGTPTQGMDVQRNAFSHTQVWGHWFWYRWAAMAQADGQDDLHQAENVFGAAEAVVTPGCDFDGDQINDQFAANGAIWRFRSGNLQGADNWRYLNDSTLLPPQLEFGDRNGDRLCDVRVRSDGRIAWGGRSTLTQARRADLAWQNPHGGPLRITRLNNGEHAGDIHPPNFPTDRDVLGTGDFDADGDGDVLVRKRTPSPLQEVFVSRLQGGQIVGEGTPGFVEQGTQFRGIGDFDGDDRADVLWQRLDGSLYLWLKEDTAIATDVSWRNAGGIVSSDWKVKGVGDFNGDGHADILWRNDGGQVSVWLMVGGVYAGEYYPGGADPTQQWSIQGVGDFDGDNAADVLWRHRDGGLAIWFKADNNLAAYPTWLNAGQPTTLNWHVKGIGDFNADGRSDILWRENNGLVDIWLMNGATYVAEPHPFPVDNNWKLFGVVPAY